MQSAKRETYKMPREWVERIFLRLTEIYGEKFTSLFPKADHREFEIERWRSGLYGLSSEEIRKVINLCLNNKIKHIPSVIDFYHYGKNWKLPAPERPPLKSASKEVVNQYMAKIKGIISNANRTKPSVS